MGFMEHVETLFSGCHSHFKCCKVLLNSEPKYCTISSFCPVLERICDQSKLLVLFLAFSLIRDQTKLLPYYKPVKYLIFLLNEVTVTDTVLPKH